MSELVARCNEMNVELGANGPKAPKLAKDPINWDSSSTEHDSVGEEGEYVQPHGGMYIAFGRGWISCEIRD